VVVHPGVHPAPDAKVSATTRTFLNMFAGKFAFFDPEALDQLSIDGAAELLIPLFGYVIDSNQKLAPFALAESIRKRHPLVETIPRVECPSEAVVRDAIADYQPLLITGAVASWPWACKSWTPESMVRDFGHERVTTAAPHAAATETVKETLASFVASSSSRGGSGLLPRSLRNAAGYPGYFQPSDYRWPFFFMGTRGAISPIHRDLAHNFAVHLFGRKRWRIFSPAQSELLYPSAHHDGPSAQTCEVDIEAPDLERFPLYAEARPMDFVVEGGEILLMPSGWFHHVVSLELTLNIAYSLKWTKGHPGEIDVGTQLLDLTAGEEEG
jgi:hypothetical protein